MQAAASSCQLKETQGACQLQGVACLQEGALAHLAVQEAACPRQEQAAGEGRLQQDAAGASQAALAAACRLHQVLEAASQEGLGEASHHQVQAAACQGSGHQCGQRPVAQQAACPSLPVESLVGQERAEAHQEAAAVVVHRHLEALAAAFLVLPGACPAAQAAAALHQTRGELRRLAAGAAGEGRHRAAGRKVREKERTMV